MTHQTELDFVRKQCCGCGKTNVRFTEVTGTLFCSDCLHERFFQCNHCCNWHPHDGKVPIRDSHGRARVICNTCYNSHFISCENCLHACRKGDIRIHDERNYCRFCYERMFICVGCQRRMFSHHYFDAGLCRNCYDEERKIINPDHNAKAPSEFQGQGPHFYGIELEVECDERLDRRANFARQVLSAFNGFVIVKYDGSIKDEAGRIVGFEIATAPASRQVQMDKWNIFFDKLPKGLRSYDTKTCGLHIHCSRRPLSQLTIAKMLLFINHKDNAKFVTTIAGRPPNTYCQIKNKSYKDARPARQDRYEALNLANRGTVEFRIFRGTLKRESLFKSLEFCDALIHFCGDCGFSVSDTRRVDKFVEYIKINSKEWPHLWAFICARWLNVENKLTKQFNFPLSDRPAEVEEYNNEPNPERQLANDDVIPNGTGGDDFDDCFNEDFDDFND